MAARNLSLSTANVTTPRGEYQRHRLTVRGGRLVIRDRRSNEVLSAEVTSWERSRRGLYVFTTELGEITASKAGCGCGGS